MSEPAKVSKADFPLPLLAEDTVWDDWEPKFATHIGLHGLLKYYKHEDPSAMEPEWLPAAETADAQCLKFFRSRYGVFLKRKNFSLSVMSA